MVTTPAEERLRLEKQIAALKHRQFTETANPLADPDNPIGEQIKRAERQLRELLAVS